LQNKLRSIAEVLGIFLVAASLFAVAYQIHQERKVAIAALNTSQLERFASRFEAGLGSDAFLSMYSKTYAKQNWNHGNMTDIEAAAAEVDAILFWSYAEMTFEHHREGLVSEEGWESLRGRFPYFMACQQYKLCMRVGINNCPVGLHAQSTKFWKCERSEHVI